jgi:hypothetical protein
MCEVRFKEKTTKNKAQKIKLQWSTMKKMDCDEPHLMLNEKTQPI